MPLRNGTAAVECAIAVPLLTIFVLGAIDVGQFANVYQKVSDASRKGARVAARYDSASTSQVQDAVLDYLEESSSGTAASAIAGATTVTVTDANGNSVSGSGLGSVSTGSQICVQVTVQYDPVRWLMGMHGLDGTVITATTMMRRE